MTNKQRIHISNDWEIQEDEQIRARTSKAELDQIKLYDPFKDQSGRGLISYGGMYKFLNRVNPEKSLILRANCIDYLLSVENQIPND